MAILNAFISGESWKFLGDNAETDDQRKYFRALEEADVQRVRALAGRELYDSLFVRYEL